jgi:hypothetical protein
MYMILIQVPQLIQIQNQIDNTTSATVTTPVAK